MLYNRNWYKIIIVLLLLSGLSCKKYDDGPCISFRSASNRIEGKWEVKEYLVDGIDSTEYLKNQSCYSMYEITIDKKTNQQLILFPNPDTVGCGFGGTWMFKKNKKVFSTNFGNIQILPPYGASADWEILKLTNNEFWITTIYNDKNYRIKLFSSNTKK